MLLFDLLLAGWLPLGCAARSGSICVAFNGISSRVLMNMMDIRRWLFAVVLYLLLCFVFLARIGQKKKKK
jgi:hypothetical protein